MWLLWFASCLIIRILLCHYFRRMSIIWSILRGDKSRLFLKSVILIDKRSWLRLNFLLVFNILCKVHIKLYLLTNLRRNVLFITQYFLLVMITLHLMRLICLFLISIIHIFWALYHHLCRVKRVLDKGVLIF